jgi:DNA-binding beta-propeller fold protein YncE
MLRVASTLAARAGAAVVRRVCLPCSILLAVSPAIAEPVLVGQRGEFGTFPGQFDAVTGNAVNAGDTLYVADHHLQRITMFNAQGQLLGVWGTPGSAPGQLRVPVALAVDAGGDVYVSDQENHRIQRFTRSGGFLAALGAFGDAPGQFVYPAGICLTPTRQLYVADSGNRRIQHFDWSGATPTFVRAFGDATLLNSPNDVALDANGFVFVTDASLHRVHKFGPDGVLIRSWGEEGLDPGQFTAPFDVIVDGASLHVSDSGNGRIQVFDLNGVFQFIWPSASFLPAPTRMTLAANRHLYVSAALARRVLVYQLDPVSTQRTPWSDVKGAYR